MIYFHVATPNATILAGGESCTRAFGNVTLEVPSPYMLGGADVPDRLGLGFEFGENALSGPVMD